MAKTNQDSPLISAFQQLSFCRCQQSHRIASSNHSQLSLRLEKNAPSILRPPQRPLHTPVIRSTIPHTSHLHLPHINYTPNARAIMHIMERLIDPRQILAMRDELVDLEFAALIVRDELAHL